MKHWVGMGLLALSLLMLLVGKYEATMWGQTGDGISIFRAMDKVGGTSWIVLAVLFTIAGIAQLFGNKRLGRFYWVQLLAGLFTIVTVVAVKYNLSKKLASVDTYGFFSSSIHFKFGTESVMAIVFSCISMAFFLVLSFGLMASTAATTKQERLAKSIQAVQQKYARAREETQRKRLDAANKQQKNAELEKWKETWKAELASLGDGQFPGETKTLHLPGNIPLEMAWCPPGTFLMGSPMDEQGREEGENQHQVTLTQGFWMAKTPLTRIQWNTWRGKPSTDMKGGDLPVTEVSWTDANDFCHKFGLALPTEAQWEYACRAGTTGPYGGSGTLDEMGWFAGNSGGVCHPVGQKTANAWGLHDMHGNVGEWCQDWMDPYQAGAAENPKGPAFGYRKVFRGGSVKSIAERCRSARRNKGAVTNISPTLGFRPVKIPKDAAAGAPTA